VIIIICSNIINICKKTPALDSSQRSNKQSTSQTVSPVVTAPAPLPVGVTSLITLSVAEALDSTQRISAFLTRLKDMEANQAGNLTFFFNYLGFLVPFTD
jgi:hypothetical protein